MGSRNEVTDEPIRLLEMVKSFHLGGTEVQVVELLRGLPTSFRVQVGVLDEEGAMLEEVWRMGHLTHPFPLHGGVAQANTLLQVGRLATWLVRNRIEVVHVHDFYPTLIAVPAAKLAGVRVIVGRLDLAHFHTKTQRALLAEMTRRADHVIANASAIREMLISEERVAPERISVIHNGLDLARFDARRKAGLDAPLPAPEGRPVLVHVANLTHPVKRQEDLIEALARLESSGTRLCTYLVGDGVRRPELTAKVQALGLAQHVHFLGHRRDIPAIWAAADLGVLCSEAEGLSNAVMEGMAAGKPMVVTDVGGNPDLVDDGVRGRVVPKLQPARLAEGIAEVLSDEKRARRMGRAARAFVRRELTLSAMVRNHAALYRRLARGDRGDAAQSTSAPMAWETEPQPSCATQAVSS